MNEDKVAASWTKREQTRVRQRQSVQEWRGW